MGNLLSSTSSTIPDSSIQSRILIEAQSLRQEAEQLRTEAKKVSEQSQYEYNSGSKSQAKALSTEKNALYKKMDEKNHRAAELIFEYHNQNRPRDVIDLHGLYVKEALKYVQNKLDECRSNNILQLTIITGMGNNSPNNIAKIKPEVQKYARENNLRITCYDGHILVDMTAGNQLTKTTNSQNKNECIIL